MKTTTGIVYAKVSFAVSVSGFALVPVLLLVGACEGGAGPAAWAVVGGVFAAVIILLNVSLMKRRARRGAGGESPRSWRTTRLKSGVSGNPKAIVLAVLGGLIFIAGSMIPILPVLAGWPLKGDMGPASRIVFGMIFLLCGLGLVNLAITAIVCPDALEPMTSECDAQGDRL